MSKTEAAASYPKIYEAVAGMIGDVGAIGKNRRTQGGGGPQYSFRGIDDVYDAIHPLLAKHRVFPVASVLSEERSERLTHAKTIQYTTIIRMRYTFYTVDGSSIQTEAIGEATDMGDKASNKAMSIAYKYALFQLLCIPLVAEDPDETVPSHTVPKSAVAAAPQAKPAQATKSEIAPLPNPKLVDRNNVSVEAEKAKAVSQAKQRESVSPPIEDPKPEVATDDITTAMPVGSEEAAKEFLDQVKAASIDGLDKIERAVNKATLGDSKTIAHVHASAVIELILHRYIMFGNKKDADAAHRRIRLYVQRKVLSHSQEAKLLENVETRRVRETPVPQGEDNAEGDQEEHRY